MRIDIAAAEGNMATAHGGDGGKEENVLSWSHFCVSTKAIWVTCWLTTHPINSCCALSVLKHWT